MRLVARRRCHQDQPARQRQSPVVLLDCTGGAVDPAQDRVVGQGTLGRHERNIDVARRALHVGEPERAERRIGSVVEIAKGRSVRVCRASDRLNAGHELHARRYRHVEAVCTGLTRANRT